MKLRLTRFLPLRGPVRSLSIVATAAISLASAHAQNAPVIFGEGKPITGDADVWNYGTTTWARFSGTADSPQQNVNGVMFLTGSAAAAGQPAKDLSWNGSSSNAVTTFYVNMHQGTLANGSSNSAATTGAFKALSSSYQGTVDFSAPFWSSSQTWSVFEASTPATISSIFQNFEVLGGANYNPSLGSFSMTPSGTLVWAAVPEPSTALAGLVLVAGLMRRRRD